MLSPDYSGGPSIAPIATNASASKKEEVGESTSSLVEKQRTSNALAALGLFTEEDEEYYRNFKPTKGTGALRTAWVPRPNKDHTSMPPPPPPLKVREQDQQPVAINVGRRQLSMFNTAPKKKRIPHFKQEDAYMRQGRLLHVATTADESVERMLLVVRFILHWVIDVLRPDEGINNMPLYTIGTHYGSRRFIQEGPDDSVVLFLQEMLAYDDEIEPYPLKVEGRQLAEVRLDLDPIVKARTLGLLSKSVQFELDFRGEGSVRLDQHEESYKFNLPKLIVEDPTGPKSRLNYEGEIEVRCGARATVAKLEFDASGTIKGSMHRTLGPTKEHLSDIYGRWDDRVYARSGALGAAGLVFDAGASVPGAQKFSRYVNMSKLGPRYVPRVWTCLHDALYSVDPATGASGKAAKAAAVAIKTSIADLSLKIEPLGMTIRADEDEVNDELELDQLEEAERNKGPKGLFDGIKAPPCVKGRKEKGERLWYALWYRLMLQDPYERDFRHHNAKHDWIPEGALLPEPPISIKIKEMRAKKK